MSPVVAAAVAGAVIVAGACVRLLSIAGSRALAAGRLVPIVGDEGAQPGTAGPSAPMWFARMLEGAGIDHGPSGWWRGWIGGVLASAIASLVVAGPGAAAVAVVAAAVGPPAALHGLRHRGEQRLEESLPVLLDVTAAALRSGASLPQALAAASTRPGRLAGELRQVVVAVGRGAPLVGELERWAARQPMPGLRLATTALALGADAGGARAQAVDGVADTLRDRLALQREINAQSAQARSSAAVMTAVPLVVAVLAAASDPRTAAFLFRSWPGLVCVLGGLALDGTAGLWMLRLIRNAS
jgi:tight adherence protein B